MTATGHPLITDEDRSSVQAYILAMSPDELRAFAFGVLFARCVVDDDTILATVASSFREKRAGVG